MADVIDALRVANLAGLAALSDSSSPRLRHRRFYPVEDASTAGDGSGPPGLYYYDATSFVAESLPAVVAHPSGGRFFATGGAPTVDLSSPGTIPLVAVAPTIAPDPLPPAETAAMVIEESTPPKLWAYVNSAWVYLEFAVPVDPFIALSVLTLNPNEADGSTTFTDLSPTPATASIISIGGTLPAMAHTTAVVQSGYGSSSIRFKSGFSTEVRALSFPASADWQIDGDYTIEAWVYRNGAENVQIASSGHFFESFYWWLKVDSAGKVGLYDDSSTYLESDTATVPASQWVHVAAVITGGTAAKIYADGVEVASATGLTFPTGTARPLYLGTTSDGSDYGDNTDHYLGPMRIVKGVVYSAPFTPPSTPFPY